MVIFHALARLSLALIGGSSYIQYSTTVLTVRSQSRHESNDGDKRLKRHKLLITFLLKRDSDIKMSSPEAGTDYINDNDNESIDKVTANSYGNLDLVDSEKECWMIRIRKLF